ncbi:MAG: 16S rRNA (guanine(527)-N(7))-methyltransferase RsmG [Bacilli bacterium]|nr:16S rRNA (guanine(527)-N(7))-methyltransferase RsmG [Bacilli bacterium]
MTYEELFTYCQENNIPLDEDKLSKLKIYATTLVETNKVMNLTAIKDEPGIIEKHFLDCLLPCKAYDFEGKTLVDVGSGAGFPGVVLAIMYPTLQVTCIDATKKKYDFICGLKEKLGLDNLNPVNSRVEVLKSFREKFDVGTARAFSSLSTILEVVTPLVKVGGYVLAMKSAKAEEEIAECKTALRKMESKVEKLQRETLPTDHDLRINIFIKKCQKTAKHFPRSWAEIVSKPL